MERMAPIYSDFSLKLAINPMSKEMMRLVDAQAIRESIKTIFKLRRFDVPYSSDKHAHIEEFLFDPVSVSTAASLKDRIEWALKSMEIRATFEVEVNPIMANNSTEHDGYEAFVTYEIKSLDIKETVREFLERVR